MNKIAAMVSALKKLGIKNIDEADPATVQKVIKSLKGESDDAVAKLGSGKNLDVLQQAKMGAPSMDAPVYPKNVGRDEVNFTMPKEDPGFTMPHPEAQVPALRTQTMPATTPVAPIKPSVIDTTGKIIPDANPFNVGQAAPKGMGDVAESMKGQLDDALNPGMSNLKKGLITAGGLGAGALGLGMLDNEQAAPAAELPVSGGQTLASEKAKEIAAPAKQITGAPTGFKASDLASKLKDSYGPDGQAARDPASEPSYLELLRQAQQGQIDNTFTNNMLKAGQTIGSALANNKADYTVADSLQSQAGQGVQNILQNMKSQKDQTELTDDKTLRDPKSDVSKAFRSTLAKLGIPHSENTTAWDAKAMGINPQNLLMQDRALEKQMKLLENKDRKETDAFVTGAQKTLMKPYKEYQKVANAKASLDGYLKGESSGPKDVAILYDFIKGLDPESAVKEGEIELARQGMSIFEKYGIQAKKLTQSDILSPKFRKAISEIMHDKEAQARSTYEEIRQPFLLHGASRGLDEADYGRFDYMSANDAKKTLNQDPKSVVTGQFPKQVRNNKGKVATVANEKELAEAQAEGFN
jgi:hypothetical protein